MQSTRTHARGPRTATLILGTTITASAAANLGATWTDVPWMVAGIAATAAVPMAMHLWPHIASGPGWQRVVRLLATATIVMTAAAVTMAHAVALLGHGPLTYAVVVSVELLGVLAAMARATGSDRTMVHPDRPTETSPDHAAHQVDRPDRPTETTPVEVDRATDTAPEPVDHPVAHPDHEDEDTTRIRATIAAHWTATGQPPSQRAVADELGMARSTLRRRWADAYAAALESIEAVDRAEADR